MSNWTRSICKILYFQCQTGHDISVQCFTINVQLGTIYLYNALLLMSNWTWSICTILYYQCQTGHDLSVQYFTFIVKLDMIYPYNALLSMSNRTQSISKMLHYQSQTIHDLSVAIPNLYLSFNKVIQEASCSLNKEQLLSIGNPSRVYSNWMNFGF